MTPATPRLRSLPVLGEPGLPPWIREKKLRLLDLHEMKSRMRRGSLSTVCEEARCPNRTECFERKTATFLIAGDVCTRACGFCHITSGRPASLDPEEPARLVLAANESGLDGVLLATHHNIAWLTGGRSNRVDASRESGTARLLVTKYGGRFVLERPFPATDWLRRLWHSGPLSRLRTRVVMCGKRARTLSHQRVKQSTKQSLVTREVTP